MGAGDTVPSEDEVREALRTVEDPEVGINIVDLGLVYRIDVTPECVRVEMTMTTQACPMGDLITDNARRAVAARVPEGVEVDIVLVWEPFWTPDRMSESAKQTFGWPT